MKLILCELRKLLSSRAVAVLLIILLAANFVLTYYTSRTLPVEEGARRVYSQYLRDTLALISYKEQLEVDFFEHLRDDDFEIPSTFIEGVDDMSVLNKVFVRAEFIENYRLEIERLVDSAERRAQDLEYFGYSEDSFYVRRQKALASIYTKLADELDSVNEYAYGYDVYFESTNVCFFILIWLLFAVSFIIRNDGVCGFGSIMMATTYGRLESAWAKIAAVVTVSVFATLLFLGTAFIAVGLANGGFSSVTAPVQLLPNYDKVPFEVSMLGYLGIQTGCRLLAFVIFALFLAVTASLGFNYVFCFGIGTMFAAGNYYVFTREYLGTTPPIKYLNIASAAEGVDLLSFYRDLNIFGNAIQHIVAMVVIYSASIVGLSFLCVLFYCKNSQIRLPKTVNWRKIAFKTSKKNSKSALRVRHLHPLWVYELQKNRFVPLFLLSLILLAVYCGFVSASVGSGATYGEAIYYGYIADIKELSAKERQMYLAEDRSELESVIYDYESTTKAYELGEVTQDEYSSFLQKYYKAKDREKVLENVEEYSNYIDRKSASLGIKCDIIYNTGYEQFFSMGTNWFLVTAIITLCIGAFSVEYQAGNCAQIICTAKKGRKWTFFSKLLPYTILGALFGVSFRLAGLIIVANNYEISDYDATLCSIYAFKAVMNDISIQQYLITDIIISMLSAMLIACTVCLISCLLKKVLHCLTVVEVTLVLPAYLSNTGFALVNLTAPNNVYCASFLAGVERNQLYFISILFLHILAITVFFIITMRAFVSKT